jgi:A/G-specific adenine glycosylase
LTPAVIHVIRRRLLSWGRENFRDFPWRTEKRPWLALAAEVMLQRTKASQVVPVFEEFRTRYPTPDVLARDTPSRLRETMGSLGLHWRGAHMIAMAGIVADRGALPEDEADLRRLPGVGPYAAAAFRSLHRGQRSVIVDANVVRWLGRLFAFKTGPETRRDAWLIDLADQLTPIHGFRDYNYAVLDFTMTVCARVPTCSTCTLATDVCAFAKAHRAREAAGRRQPNGSPT